MHSSERVTVTKVMSPISHKLLFVPKRMLLFLHCLPLGGVSWCLLLNGPLCLLCSIVLLEAALQFVFTLQIGESANVLTVTMCILLFKFCICV